MNKKFFLIVVLCVSLAGSTLGKGGYNDDKIFTMGPQLSLLLTDVNFDGNAIKTGFAPGFGASVFFRIGKMVHFQPEISYSLKNFKFKTPFQELEYNPKFSTHSLSFTPMIGVSAVNNEDFKFRIFFGPEGGIILKNGYKGNKNPWTKYEYGGKVGIGFDAYNVTLDIGYKFLMSKNSDIIDGAITTAYQRQNMIFFSVGYCIF
jgi:hypothetical protein